MQSYTYSARDPLGKLIAGTLEVDSRDEALLRLKREGLQVVEIDEEGESFELLPRRIKQAEIIYVASQLAVMVDTGINLSVALGSIAEQEANPALKEVLLDLRNRVEGGEDFSSALARHPRQFDKTFVAMMKAAEQTGRLGEMLDGVAGYLRGQLETRQKVRASLAYPSIMAVLAVAVTIFLLTYILPKFEPLFSRKGVKLPKPTVIMMTASDLLIDYWPLWIVAAIAGTIAFFVGKRTEAGRQALDWVMINLPIVGPMVRKVTISRSIRTLGTMVASGVSMLDAIRLTAEVSGNYYYEKIWLRVLDEITQGNRIVDALRNEPLLPPTLVQMIGAGEETGKLDTVLAKVSSYYDREVETSLKATTSLIEPLMICAMGFVVGGIALGLLMPIFQLSRPGH
ncbi:MAG: type II secretion system F family protein [Pirellulaceae bacterium]|jgi:type IV pilus assembly protein PilC|nr:type II secretion system F family protein [Pirellulaceae bacterium]